MQELTLKAAGMLVMILLGVLMKAAHVLQAGDSKILAKIIIHLTLPAALINSFRTFRFEASYLSLILIAAAGNILLLAAAFALTRRKDGVTRALYGLNLSSYNIGTFVLPFA